MQNEEDEYVNRNFHWLFERAEAEANEIDEELQSIIQNPDYSVAEVEENMARLGNGEEFMNDTNVIDLISLLNSDQDQLSDEYIVRYMETFPNVYDVQIANPSDSGNVNFSSIETNEGYVEFLAISELLKHSISYSQNGGDNEVKKYCDDVENIAKRNGNCHRFSIRALKLLTEHFDIKTNIVTGNVRYYVPDNKYIHSWLEFYLAGKLCALDSTKNIIMDKDAYYRLLHIDEEKDIYSVIKSDDVINDEKQYGGLIEELDYKTYLTTRDEMIRDLERNKQLFEKQNNDSSEVR